MRYTERNTIKRSIKLQNETGGNFKKVMGETIKKGIKK